MTPDLDAAVHLLQAGALVAFPTETVYGLGADATQPEAVARIFSAKGRPADHPLIVHLPGDAFLEEWAIDIPPLAWELAEDFWPGPLTLILKRRPDVPDAVTGGQETVGLRVPGHPLALRLLRTLADAGGGRDGRTGVAAPSANRFGRISPTTAAHVRDELGSAVSLILDGGPCQVGIESTIIDLSTGTPHLLRPGHITPEAIESACGIRPHPPAENSPRASGTLEAHYAPRTAMRAIESDRLRDFLNAFRHSGRRCGVISHTQAPIANQPHVWRQLPATPAGYARELYATLRELDHANVDLIVVEALPTPDTWHAVSDRLRRALAGSSPRPSA